MNASEPGINSSTSLIASHLVARVRGHKECGGAVQVEEPVTFPTQPTTTSFGMEDDTTTTEPGMEEEPMGDGKDGGTTVVARAEETDVEVVGLNNMQPHKASLFVEEEDTPAKDDKGERKRRPRRHKNRDRKRL
jgi:hypothetical protein